MSHQEEKISKFLDYPYDSFLMLRLEFMLIFQDELIAKVLRIIEKEIETERKRLYRETVNKMGTTPTGVVDITKDIYVPISYKTFMSDLFDTVTSENTLKRAVKELEKMKVIFRRHDQKKRYDAPEYKIHQPVLQMLLSMLKKPGYQILIPSTIEALKKLHPHEMTPSECQSLIPSIEDLSTNPESRVSKFDPNYNNSNTNNSNNKEVTYAVLSDDKNSNTPASLSLQDMIAFLQASGYRISQDETPSQFPTQATAVENPGQLADRVTVSQPGDNGVREATDSLAVENGVDLPALSLEPPTPLSPKASQNEVVQASNGQSPIAAVTTRNPDEEHAPLSQSGESGGDIPTGSGASEQDSVQPEQPKRGGGRKKKQAVDLDHVEVLPPPAKPDESTDWTARKVLAWGDYFRGYALPASENGNSHYKQNEKAAVSLIQRGITEKNYVSVFRFMRGQKIMQDGTLANDPTFRDEWWPENMSADVRHVEKHFTDMCAKIKGRGKNGQAKGVSIQQQLQDKVPDFPVLSQVELMRMQPAQRKEYSQQFDAYLKAQREREERIQSEQQHIVQQASA